LVWSTVTGAVSYNVNRALADSGPYALVANTTATSFTDTGLGNGTTYRYVVAALNAATESLNSAQAAATPLSALQQWRQTNFGTTANTGDAADDADPDGDGMTNAQEFPAGTDPRNAASVFRVSGLAIDDNHVLLSFPTVAGRIYRLERSDGLLGNPWTPVQENIPGTGGILQLTDPAGFLQPKRFYRIVVSP
jgi:hypothetical protein